MAEYLTTERMDSGDESEDTQRARRYCEYRLNTPGHITLEEFEELYSQISEQIKKPQPLPLQ